MKEQVERGPKKKLEFRACDPIFEGRLFTQNRMREGILVGDDVALRLVGPRRSSVMVIFQKIEGDLKVVSQLPIQINRKYALTDQGEEVLLVGSYTRFRTDRNRGRGKETRFIVDGLGKPVQTFKELGLIG